MNMDFNSNREKLLNTLKSKQRSKRRAQENARVRARLKERALEPEGRRARHRKKDVLVYGHPGLFLGTVKSVLEEYGNVKLFNNITKASEYVLSQHIPLVVMDMDPPSDWRMCHDLFTTGKTMYPDIEYIIFQKNKVFEEPVQILENQGARVLTKPLNSAQFGNIVNAILYK
ncbi:MAG: hypothetical protein ACQEQV_03105 [Fibrobacterota bacterium]